MTTALPTPQSGRIYLRCVSFRKALAMDDDVHGLPQLDGADPALVKAVTSINCAFTDALVSIARDGVAQGDGSRVDGLTVVRQFMSGFLAFDVSVHGLRFRDGPDMPPGDPGPPPGAYL
jgi:hypothetical protein